MVRAGYLRDSHGDRKVAGAQLRDFEIGQTVLGRPIIALQFEPTGADGADRPPVLYFGAIHGDEPLGTHCLGELARSFRDEAPAREAWVVAALNADGLLAGTKNNANDVDLNRNFAASNWRADHAPGYFPGAAPESEPETRALVALAQSSGATRFVSVHSPFRVVNWDGAGEALAVRMGELNGYGASGDIGYPTPGSFGSRYGVDYGLEVVTLEIPFVSAAEAWEQNREALRLAASLFEA